MSNEWIKWEGWECPVDGGLEVVVILRDGTEQILKSDKFDWVNTGSYCDIIAYRLHCNCDGCTDGDDEIPEFLKNDFKNDSLTDHELDEPGDGIPEELAIEDIPPVLRPETETLVDKENTMDDLERLARELHKAREGVDSGWIFEGNVFFGCGMQTGFNIPDIQAKRDELSGKPEKWVNDWARWRVQQLDGFWFEYEEKPRLHAKQNYWLSDGGKSTPTAVSNGEVLGDSRDTLEERVMENKAVVWVDGLPPFGEEAECRSEKDGNWRWCQVKAYDENEIWMAVRGNGQSNLYRREAYEFRPVKTPKEKAIEEMQSVLGSAGFDGGVSDEILEVIYEAGFKK